MSHPGWQYVNGLGELCNVVITGKPEQLCYGCRMALAGALIGCLQHGVTRKDIPVFNKFNPNKEVPNSEP